ncbi:hypothetical protein L596_000552 [Steinernema carpocapsae]|uniref:Uncharacterized protein n=1 Tax=Steinernema carpocapsae TaxID=34508 RepID=A0A4U8UJU2_STECR|nr:hypothetical protein L596_000552 [Steinernema carpocapsae]
MQNVTYSILVLLLAVFISTIIAAEEDLARGDTSSDMWNVEQMGPYAPRQLMKRSNLYALFKKVNYEANRRKLYNEMVKKADSDYFF